MNELAFEFVKSLAAELSAGTIDLPSFPGVVERVRKALEDPNNSPQRTAQIVGAEPALAARLLAVANSAAFTCTGQPVTELRTAITRLGDNLVRSTALSFAMAEIRRQAPQRTVQIRLRELWVHSTRVAALCYVLARRTSISADEAFLTGLLHGIGKLYVLIRAAQHPSLFQDTAALEDIMGSWHAAIGKAILENWNFPERMTQAVSEQDDLDRKHYGNADLGDVLVCATLLARFTGDEAALAEPLRSVEACRQLRLDLEHCRTVLQDADVRVAALQEALG